MLVDLQIANFRCLHAVNVRFEPLTIFVGPNASGKSALLLALDPNLHPTPEDFWQKQEGTCERTFRFERDVIARRQVIWARGAALRTAGDAIWFGYQYLQLDPRALRGVNLLTEQSRLERDGSNLANVFTSLTRRQQERLVADFSRVVPVFRDVMSKPTGNGTHHLVFQDRWSEVWYEPSYVSDGSLIVLALLTLQYQSPPVDLIAIEEIERGLHPYLEGEILSVLRKMSRGELGPKRTQVVLATHSTELLELADPKEVRFCSRMADGGVAIDEVSTPDWRQTLKEKQGSVRNLWLAGNLAGVASAPAV